jgi:hypothetical protein
MGSISKFGAVNSVHDMEIDEVSLVDIPANPHSLVMIQKNFQEVGMADNATDDRLFDQEGNELDDEYELTPGEVIFNADGEAFQFDPEAVEEGAQEEEYAEVGKSVFFQGQSAQPSEFSKSLAAELRETLSKSATDASTRAVLSKALEAVQASDERALEAVAIAKSERAIRLTGQFVEVAKGYNVPADPNELGAVLMRMNDSMSQDDCSVIHKALSAAGDIIFEEIGITGNATADGSDPMEQAEQYAASQVSKSGSEVISKAKAVEEFYMTNPDAYEDYLAAKRG